MNCSKKLSSLLVIIVYFLLSRLRLLDGIRYVMREISYDSSSVQALRKYAIRVPNFMTACWGELNPANCV